LHRACRKSTTSNNHNFIQLHGLFWWKLPNCLKLIMFLFKISSSKLTFSNISSCYCNVTSPVAVYPRRLGGPIWMYYVAKYYWVWGMGRTRSAEMPKHSTSEVKCWLVNFNWGVEMLVRSPLFSVVAQQLKTSMFTSFLNQSSELQCGIAKPIIIKLPFAWHSTQWLYSFLLYLHIGLKKKILRNCPNFFQLFAVWCQTC